MSKCISSGVNIEILSVSKSHVGTILDSVGFTCRTNMLVVVMVVLDEEVVGVVVAAAGADAAAAAAVAAAAAAAALFRIVLDSCVTIRIASLFWHERLSLEACVRACV